MKNPLIESRPGTTTANTSGPKVWVSIGERMPEDGEEVELNCRGRFYRAPGGGCFIRDEVVTHWYPLPEGPES